MRPPPILPPSFFLLKSFLFLSFFFPTYFASDGKVYTDCVPFSCGKFREISYPFWSSNQPEYCGHPKFKLDCQGENATIDIMSQKFLIIDINPRAPILKIARLDFWGNICPKEYTNVSLDFAFFDYTPNDVNSTLLYDCDTFPYTPPVNFSPPMSFSCPIDGIPRNAYIVLSTPLPSVNFIDLGCNISITVPVLKAALPRIFEYAFDVDHVLEEGFEVGWSGVDGAKCDSCRQSGGICGHNVSRNEFICFCSNQQTYGGICGNSTAWSPLPTPPNLSKSSEQSDQATSMYSSFS